jgi:hypothetical protein
MFRCSRQERIKRFELRLELRLTPLTAPSDGVVTEQIYRDVEVTLGVHCLQPIGNSPMEFQESELDTLDALLLILKCGALACVK